jgi:hypothetical protein
MDPSSIRERWLDSPSSRVSFVTIAPETSWWTGFTTDSQSTLPTLSLQWDYSRMNRNGHLIRVHKLIRMLDRLGLSIWSRSGKLPPRVGLSVFEWMGIDGRRKYNAMYLLIHSTADSIDLDWYLLNRLGRITSWLRYTVQTSPYVWYVHP